MPDEVEIRRRRPASREAPRHAHLQLEVARCAGLLRMAGRSLAQLDAALRGKGVFYEELDQLSRELEADAVPPRWLEAGFPSLKPLAAWLREVSERADFLGRWGLGATPPVSFWLGGLFLPRSFLACLLLEHARRQATTVDGLAFQFRVLSQASPTDPGVEARDAGALVHGLLLEGCRWSRSKGCLAEARPREPAAPLPLLWCMPSVATGGGVLKSAHYRAPVYRVASRGEDPANLVVTVDLPSTEHPDVWVLAGVALLLSAGA